MPDKTWARFNGYLYKYWKLETLVIIFGLLTIPLSLLNPYLTKFIIDEAYDKKDLKLFFILAAIGTVIFILSALITSISGYLSRKINRHIQYDLTRDLFRHMQSLPLSFFHDRSTGENIFRINQDTDAVSSFISNTITQIATLIPRLLLVLGMIFYLNWKLALFAMILIPVAYIQPYFFGKWLREMAKKTTQSAQGVFKELQEIFSHIQLIKAFGKEKEAIEKFERIFSERINQELKNAKLTNISSFTGSMLNKALCGVIALYGGYEVIQGTTTLGSLTAIMIYLTQFIGLLQTIGTLYQTTVINSVNRRRVADIFDITPFLCNDENALKWESKKGSIELRNVSFSYKKNNPILKDISFLIEPGSKVAFAGLSGCGKTTVLSLILRLIEPEKGAVLIDGMNIKEIKLSSLKSGTSLALQEPYLWNDTIANNILYGADKLSSFEDVVWAARMAEIHEFIIKLPNGYDSNIGEMGRTISEGQKQRIAMARAIINKPKILILDEAMAALDSQTEDKILKNILLELKDSTILMVSHRLSTVKKMDRVYFLENDSVIKTGTPQELLTQNASYRDLFASYVHPDANNQVLI